MNNPIHVELKQNMTDTILFINITLLNICVQIIYFSLISFTNCPASYLLDTAQYGFCSHALGMGIKI